MINPTMKKYLNILYGKMAAPKLTKDDQEWMDTLNEELEKSRAGLLLNAVENAYAIYNAYGIEGMCDYLENLNNIAVSAGARSIKAYIIRDASSPLSDDDKSYLAIFNL